ncbi:MAG: hypothetical protein AABW99_01305 [archaeon]
MEHSFQSDYLMCIEKEKAYLKVIFEFKEKHERIKLRFENEERFFEMHNEPNELREKRKELKTEKLAEEMAEARKQK